jgi:hypothetical protein
VLVIGAGVTLHEAIAAANELSKASINIRVLDPFTVKPIDSEAIIANAKECGGRILTVEDHYPEGIHKQLQGTGFLIFSCKGSVFHIAVDLLSFCHVCRFNLIILDVEQIYGTYNANILFYLLSNCKSA